MFLQGNSTQPLNKIICGVSAGTYILSQHTDVELTINSGGFYEVGFLGNLNFYLYFYLLFQYFIMYTKFLKHLNKCLK